MLKNNRSHVSRPHCVHILPLQFENRIIRFLTHSFCKIKDVDLRWILSYLYFLSYEIRKFLCIPYFCELFSAETVLFLIWKIVAHSNTCRKFQFLLRKLFKGEKLFKGGNYLRKYGIWKLEYSKLYEYFLHPFYWLCI